MKNIFPRLTFCFLVIAASSEAMANIRQTTTPYSFILDNASSAADNVPIRSSFTDNLNPNQALGLKLSLVTRQMSLLGYAKYYAPGFTAAGYGENLPLGTGPYPRRYPVPNDCINRSGSHPYFNSSCTHYGPTFEQDSLEGHILHTEISRNSSHDYLIDLVNGQYSASLTAPPRTKINCLGPSTLPNQYQQAFYGGYSWSSSSGRVDEVRSLQLGTSQTWKTLAEMGQGGLDKGMSVRPWGNTGDDPVAYIESEQKINNILIYNSGTTPTAQVQQAMRIIFLNKHCVQNRGTQIMPCQFEMNIKTALAGKTSTQPIWNVPNEHALVYIDEGQKYLPAILITLPSSGRSVKIKNPINPSVTASSAEIGASWGDPTIVPSQIPYGNMAMTDFSHFKLKIKFSLLKTILKAATLGIKAKKWKIAQNGASYNTIDANKDGLTDVALEGLPIGSSSLISDQSDVARYFGEKWDDKNEWYLLKLQYGHENTNPNGHCYGKNQTSIIEGVIKNIKIQGLPTGY